MGNNDDMNLIINFIANTQGMDKFKGDVTELLGLFKQLQTIDPKTLNKELKGNFKDINKEVNINIDSIEKLIKDNKKLSDTYDQQKRSLEDQKKLLEQTKFQQTAKGEVQTTAPKLIIDKLNIQIKQTEQKMDKLELSISNNLVKMKQKFDNIDLSQLNNKFKNLTDNINNIKSMKDIDKIDTSSINNTLQLTDKLINKEKELGSIIESNSKKRQRVTKDHINLMEDIKNDPTAHLLEQGVQGPILQYKTKKDALGTFKDIYKDLGLKGISDKQISGLYERVFKPTKDTSIDKPIEKAAQAQDKFNSEIKETVQLTKEELSLLQDLLNIEKQMGLKGIDAVKAFSKSSMVKSSFPKMSEEDLIKVGNQFENITPNILRGFEQYKTPINIPLPEYKKSKEQRIQEAIKKNQDITYKYGSMEKPITEKYSDLLSSARADSMLYASNEKQDYVKPGMSKEDIKKAILKENEFFNNRELDKKLQKEKLITNESEKQTNQVKMTQKEYEKLYLELERIKQNIGEISKIYNTFKGNIYDPLKDTNMQGIINITNKNKGYYPLPTEKEYQRDYNKKEIFGMSTMIPLSPGATDQVLKTNKVAEVKKQELITSKNIQEINKDNNKEIDKTLQKEKIVTQELDKQVKLQQEIQALKKFHQNYIDRLMQIPENKQKDYKNIDLINRQANREKLSSQIEQERIIASSGGRKSNVTQERYDASKNKYNAIASVINQIMLKEQERLAIEKQQTAEIQKQYNTSKAQTITTTIVLEQERLAIEKQQTAEIQKQYNTSKAQINALAIIIEQELIRIRLKQLVNPITLGSNVMGGIMGSVMGNVVSSVNNTPRSTNPKAGNTGFTAQQYGPQPKPLDPKVTQSWQSLTTDINLAGNALNLFGQTLYTLGKRAVDEAAEWEVLRMKLTNFSGSAKESKERFQELIQLSVTTPFEIKGIVEAEVKLRSFGVNTQTILPKVVDLAAAMGKKVEDASYAVARAMSGASLGFLMLQKTWGVSTAKLREFGAEYNVRTGKLVANSQATQNALQLVLGTLEGSATRLSHTFKGQLSNLQDALDVLREGFGRDLLPIFSTLVSNLNTFIFSLNKITPATKTVMVSISGIIGLFSIGAGSLGNFAWQFGNLLQGFKAIAGVGAKLSSTTSAVGLLSKAVTALGVAMSFLFTTPIGGVITLVAVIASVALAYRHLTKVKEEYNKQQEKDLLAEEEIKRKNILEELSLKIGKVTTSQEAYNSIIGKSAGELLKIQGVEVVFTKTLELQNLELQRSIKNYQDAIDKRNEYSNTSNRLSSETPNLSEIKTNDYGNFKMDKNRLLEAKSSNTILRHLPFGNALANKLGFSDDYMKQVDEQLKTYSIEETATKKIENEYKNKIAVEKENIKKLYDSPRNYTKMTIVNDEGISRTENVLTKQAQLQYDQYSKNIVLLTKKIGIEKEITNEVNKQLGIINNTVDSTSKIVENIKQQKNNTEYTRLETQRFAELYGNLATSTTQNKQLAAAKRNLNPEYVNKFVSDLKSNIDERRKNISNENINKYNDRKKYEWEYYNKYGFYPKSEKEEKDTFVGPPKPDLDNNYGPKKKIPDRLDKNTEEELNKLRAADITYKYATNIMTKQSQSPKELYNDLTSAYKKETYSGMSQKEIEAKMLENSSADMRSIYERQKEVFSDFNNKSQEQLSEGTLTKPQYLENLKKEIYSESNMLDINLDLRTQKLKEYNVGMKQVNKERAKLEVESMKEAGASTFNKQKEIEADRQASLMALKEEYDTKVTATDKSLALDTWYYSKRKLIQQKAHEDTLNLIESEYKERVDYANKAAIANTKFGSFSEKKANEAKRFYDTLAGIESEYALGKDNLEKQLAGASVERRKVLLEELANLEAIHNGEIKRNAEQLNQNMKKLYLEELQVRIDLQNATTEHNRRTGQINDVTMLNQQKQYSEVILSKYKESADQYEKIANSGGELSDVERTILNLVQQREEVLQGINTTLEYGLSITGKIFETEYKILNDKLSLQVAEKDMIDEVAQATKASFLSKQINFEKEKMSLLEQLELSGKITDSQRGYLDQMRGHRTEYASISNSLTGFSDSVRKAVDQAVLLKNELKYGADYTGVMSDKFKSAYDYAKSLLDTVRTIGNITAAGNAYGNMGEFSSFEDVIKSQGGFGKDNSAAAKWKAELAVKQSATSDETDPNKAAQKAIDEARTKLQAKIDAGNMTDDAMASAKAQVDDLNKQYIDGVKTGKFDTSILDKANEMSVQDMSVTATNVTVNGDTSGEDGSGKKDGGGGGDPGYNKDKDKDKKENNGLYRDNSPSKGPTLAEETTIKSGMSPIGSGDNGGVSKDVKIGNPGDQRNPLTGARIGFTSSYDDAGNYIQNDLGNATQVSSSTPNGIDTLAKQFGMTGKQLDALLHPSQLDLSKVARPEFDNPVNDNMMINIGKKSMITAVKTMIKNNSDAVNKFMTGTVSGMKEVGNSLSNHMVNSNNSNNSKQSNVTNNYNLQVDGTTINNSNQKLNNATRNVVSLSLAAKNIR
jgi:hypothetical protein